MNRGRRNCRRRTSSACSRLGASSTRNCARERQCLGSYRGSHEAVTARVATSMRIRDGARGHQGTPGRSDGRSPSDVTYPNVRTGPNLPDRAARRMNERHPVPDFLATPDEATPGEATPARRRPPRVANTALAASDRPSAGQRRLRRRARQGRRAVPSGKRSLTVGQQPRVRDVGHHGARYRTCGSGGRRHLSPARG